MSFTTLAYFLLLFIITMTEGGKKHSMDKIIIHVPYKIHKHHHTHTKYKVITIPTPKKENTVIYLKEEIQPVIHQIPSVQTHAEVAENHAKTQESFTPPHQESASALLKHLANHKEEGLSNTDQQHQYSMIVDDQKPLESHFSHTTKDLIPSGMYKPIIIPPNENFIPNLSFKPVLYPQHNFPPRLIMNSLIHNDFLPKFTYQPILHQSDEQFKPKFTFQPMLPPTKDLQDSVAHTSNQVYKTIITPRPKTVKSYKVKEEILEDNKHQRSNLKKIPVPSKKFNRKGKSYMHAGFNNHFKNMMMHPDSDYEYEHVGYLIIDGNSRKMVGKNFKDEIHLSK